MLDTQTADTSPLFFWSAIRLAITRVIMYVNIVQVVFLIFQLCVVFWASLNKYSVDLNASPSV